MNDVLDALSSRFKSPYFGYAFLAFFALNWRGLFLLFTLEATSIERLTAFDQQTNFWSLIFFPLLIGALVAIFSPWIKFLFQWISISPFTKLDDLSLEAENKRLIKQNELENSRTQQFANREKELIERAKRDEDVAEIDDEKTKEKLIAQIEMLRNERDALSDKFGNNDRYRQTLSNAATELIKAASGKNDGVIRVIRTLAGDTVNAGKFVFGNYDQRELAMYESALDELTTLGYLKQLEGNPDVWHLTHQGWLRADDLKN